MRACEAVWVREGSGSPTLEARTERNATPAWGAPFEFLMLYAWVLRYLVMNRCYTCGFFDLVCHLHAIRVGFKVCVMSRCYMRGFFHLVCHLHAIRMGFKVCFMKMFRSCCYRHGF